MNKSKDRKIIIHSDYIELELTWWEYTKIDFDTYELIKNYCWYKSLRKSVESRINNKLVKLHRLILSAPKWELVDHINWDTLDNRRCNLRICSNSENNMNKKASVISKTWIKWVRERKWKYNVQITLKWKRYRWWAYLLIEDAINAVNNLTNKLHWEYAKIQTL
jgi:hypothetical protein